MGRLSKFYSKALAAIGLRRISNNSGLVPGTDSYQILKEWIESPLKATGSFDWDLRNKMHRLRSDARTLALGNPLVRQFLALLAQNVIGAKGMRLQAQVRDAAGNLDKGTNQAIEAGWADFWRSPFVDGRMSGVSGEQMLIKTVANDGEIFVRLCVGRQFNRHGFALQVIDADLVDHQYNRPRGARGENEIRLGIEIDEWGKAQAVHVWSGYPSDLNTSIPRERQRIPASEIVQIFDPERANQTRGITWHNSVMLSAKILDGYVEASLLGQRTAACAMPLFKHTNPDLYDTDSQGNPKQQTGFSLDLTPGSGLTLPPGLEMQSFDPSKSTTNYADFIKASERFMGCGWHVSYNALANDLEGVNYSSMRSGLLIERDRWRVLQQWWIDRFRQPIYEAWLNCALLSGSVSLPSRDARKYQTVKWVPRGWTWVDPLKDVNAAILAIENGLGSRGDYLAEQGEDFEETCEQLKNEKQIALDCGLDFSAVANAAPAPDEPIDKEDDQPEEPTPADKKRTQALKLAGR